MKSMPDDRNVLKHVEWAYRTRFNVFAVSGHNSFVASGYSRGKGIKMHQGFRPRSTDYEIAIAHSIGAKLYNALHIYSILFGNLNRRGDLIRSPRRQNSLFVVNATDN